MTVKLWIARQLRKLATKADGDVYVSRTGIYKGAIAFVDELNEEIQSHVTKAMVDGGGAGTPQGIRLQSFDVVHGTRTGRYSTGATLRKSEVACECDYWPGITGSNGVITQHAIGCPRRPDSPTGRYGAGRPIPDPTRNDG